MQSAGAEQEVFKTVRDCTDRLQTTTQELEALRLQEASDRNLEAKLNVAENRNMELLAKLDGALSDKGQQAASYCDSAWTIQELLTKLKEAEQERTECKRESENQSRLAERLAQKLKQQEVKLKEAEGKLDSFNTDELQMTVNRLQGALSLKERETGNLRTQLQDLQSALETRESHLEEMKRRTQDELRQKGTLEERLKAKESELTVSTEKIRKLESDNERLAADSQTLQTQAKTLEEYKNQCTSLMEINGKLIQTVKRNEESSKELAQTKNALERELMSAQASETQLRTRLESAGLSVDNEQLEECVLNGQVKNDEPETREQSSSSDSAESTSRWALAEAQLELNMKEVCRLQEEVLELRAQLLVSSEERVKIQTLQEVTEASRDDLRAQTEQLKSQVEELNRRHVEELMRCREREDTLLKERDKEAKARARLQTEANAMREELDEVKKHNDSLALENGEAREALHRANTETAELGVHVCMLTGQNEEAKLRWEEMSASLQEIQTEAQEEVRTLSESLEGTRKESARLQERLKATEELPKVVRELQERLEKAEEAARSFQEMRQREVDTLSSQLSDEAAHHEKQVQVIEVQTKIFKRSHSKNHF